MNTYGGLLSYGHGGDASGLSLIVEGDIDIQGNATLTPDVQLPTFEHLFVTDGDLEISGSFAMLPSIENTPSVQMIFRLALRPASSLARRSSMSECLKTPVVHFVIALARRIESMIEAWLSASDRTRSPSSAIVPVNPSFAFHAET